VLTLNFVLYKTTTDRCGVKNKIEVNTVIIHAREEKFVSLTYDVKRYLQVLRYKSDGLDHSFPMNFVS